MEVCQSHKHESVDTFTTLCDFPFIHAVVLLNTVINERCGLARQWAVDNSPFLPRGVMNSVIISK